MATIDQNIDLSEHLEFSLHLCHPGHGIEALQRVSSQLRWDTDLAKDLNPIMTATDDGIDTVKKWAAHAGLDVVRVFHCPAEVRIRGTLRNIQRALSIE
ncbi:MAG: hypothetical protein KC457_37470, partial [Myxococcales bacterium]|nr:hypothetical protein [Myxococcales bacterium]